MGRSIRDGQHDFDFEIGTWTTHLRRLKSPLTGSTERVEYDGTSVVRPIWDGRANLVELDVAGTGTAVKGANQLVSVAADSPVEPALVWCACGLRAASATVATA